MSKYIFILTIIAAALLNLQVQAQPSESARLLCDYFGIRDPKVTTCIPPLSSSEKIEVEHLIATLADPNDSRLDYLFDRHLNAIQRAIETYGYVLDRYSLPWEKSVNGQEKDKSVVAAKIDYTKNPGVILYRKNIEGGKRFLVLFIVGDTPTAGLHKDALLNALEQIKLLPLQPFEQADDSTSKKVRIIGPVFSGSAVSLINAMRTWSASFSGKKVSEKPRVQIISGSATAIEKGRFLYEINDKYTDESLPYPPPVSFNTTVPLDSEAREAFLKYLRNTGGLRSHQNVGHGPEIAILTESSTEYGREIRDGETMTYTPLTNSPKYADNILYLTFPLHISQMRAEAEKAKGDVKNGISDLLYRRSDIPLPMTGSDNQRTQDIIPPYSRLEPATIERVLANIFSAINRESIHYIGVYTTDVFDRLFLIRQLRKHCPNKTIFVSTSDLLYLHSDVNLDLQGTLIVTPYPLFNLNQLWTNPHKGGAHRLQFASQSEYGIYNATAAILGEHQNMIEYGLPFNIGRGGAFHRPPLWLAIVGSNAIWPIRTLSLGSEIAQDNSFIDDLGILTYDSYTLPVPVDNKLISEAAIRLTRNSAGVYHDITSFSNSLLLLIGYLCLVPTLVLLWETFRSYLKRKPHRSIASIRKFPRLFNVLNCIQDHLLSYNFISRNRSNHIVRIFSVDEKFQFGFDRRIILFSSLISLLTVSLGCGVISAIPDISGVPVHKDFNIYDRDLILHLIIYALPIISGHLLLIILIWLMLGISKWMRKTTIGQWALVMTFFLLLCSIGLFSTATSALYTLIVDAKGNDQKAVQALFQYLRAIDLTSGVSILLPWIFMGLASFMAYFNSLRRLNISERMYSLQYPGRKSRQYDRYLNFNGSSFTGIDNLENTVKGLLIGRIFSVRGAFIILVAMMIPYVNKFVMHRIPSIEGIAFDNFFIVGFYIVPLLLGWAFLRFFWLSVALMKLLGRLGLHPLFTAPVNPADPSFQMVPKVNLMSPQPGFSAMAASVSQAKDFFVKLSTLSDERGLTDWPNPFQQRIWTRMMQAETSLEEAVKAESEGRWADTLEPGRRTQQALSHAAGEISRWMEPHWSELNDLTNENAEIIKQGRIFLMGHTVAFMQYIVVHLQNLAGLVSIGLILLLLAATSYPFQPRESLLQFSWISVIAAVSVTVFVFVKLNKDKCFALLAGGKTSQFGISGDLVYRVLVHGVAPVLVLLGAQFPEAIQSILAWMNAFQAK